MTLYFIQRVITILMATALASTAIASPPRYAMSLLENPSARGGTAFSLNDNGVVVGKIESENGDSRPAVWKNGRIQNLRDITPDEGGEALAVNARGEWVGYLGNLSRNAVPLYWRSGARMNLDFGDHAVARGLDDGERVVGERLVSEDRELYVDMVSRAFLWENGHLRDIADDIPDEGSVAAAVNNHGLVVGWSNCGCRKTPGDRAFVWDKGTVTYTGNFGGSESRAFDVNDKGIVVGEAEILHVVSGRLTRSMRAFRWDDGQLQPLETLGGETSSARGINNRTAIVGWSTNTAGETRAFLWRADKMTDLNALVSDTDGWIIRRAFDINDAGDVAGDAQRNGETRAVVLKVKR